MIANSSGSSIEDKLAQLTERQLEILFHRFQDIEVKEIARNKVFISERAVADEMAVVWEVFGIPTNKTDPKPLPVLKSRIFKEFSRLIPTIEDVKHFKATHEMIKPDAVGKTIAESEVKSDEVDAVDEPIPAPQVFQPTIPPDPEPQAPELEKSESEEAVQEESEPETKPEPTVKEEYLEVLKQRGVGEPSQPTTTAQQPETTSQPAEAAQQPQSPPISVPPHNDTARREARAGWIVIIGAILLAALCCVSIGVLVLVWLPRLFTNPTTTQQITPLPPSATVRIIQAHPSDTPTQTRTYTAVPQPTNTPTNSPTPTNTFTPTITLTPTDTLTPTIIPTDTPVPIVLFMKDYNDKKFEADWIVITDSQGSIDGGVFTPLNDYSVLIGDENWKNYRVKLSFSNISRLDCFYLPTVLGLRAKSQTNFIKIELCDNKASLFYRNGRPVPNHSISTNGAEYFEIEVIENQVKFLGKDPILNGEDGTGFVYLKIRGGIGVKKIEVIQLP